MKSCLKPHQVANLWNPETIRLAKHEDRLRTLPNGGLTHVQPPKNEDNITN